ncbi:conserved membrane protein [Chondrocystis sp. NIES-4102]|nr:conserved membrane protein [Chondrocystis sp. NIES-4102]
MIRVLVVDDLKLICRGLKAMFVAETDIEIVGFAHNGKEAIKQTEAKKPDVVIIDILMPVMGGIEATKEISKKFPQVNVIVLSSFEDEPIILEAIAAGAKGYLLKNMVGEDIAAAIRAVHRGSSHFAPGIIDNLAKYAQTEIIATKNSIVPSKVCTIESLDSPTIDLVKDKPKKTTSAPAKTGKMTAIAKSAKAAKSKIQKPLFEYGDWITVLLAVAVLSQMNGMGHDLGHAGLFLLMLALIARPIRFFWDAPLKHRRAIGIFAFAATLGHAIYATINVLDADPGIVLAMSPKNQIGILAGVIALGIMTPAAITSFQSLQRKLGKTWRQIHLLTVPALALAVLHTVLVGPHYMLEFKMEFLDHIRTYCVVLVGVLVLLMRKQIFWSVLGLNKLGKSANKKPINQEAKSLNNSPQSKELAKT